jgi:hypothetical protein
MSATNSPDLATLQADLAALKRDVGDLVAHLKSGAAASVQGAAAGLEDSAGKLFRSITDEGERSMKAVGQKVEEQPLMALLIAFGIGYLGGRVLSR